MRSLQGRTRTFPTIFLMLVTALAGCTGGDPQGASEGDDDSAPLADRIVRFGGTDAHEEGDLSGLTSRTVLTGFQGGEPTIGVLPDSTVFVQAGHETIRSTDAGHSWESVFTHAYLTSEQFFDPMLWVDPLTSRVYWSFLSEVFVNNRPVCTELGWSEDGGETWSRNPVACGSPGADFQKLGGGVPGPGDNPFVETGQGTVLYLCSRSAPPLPAPSDPTGAPPVRHDTHCAVSYDGGLTWPVENEVTGCTVEEGQDPGPGCGGVHGRPVVAADGTAYIGTGFADGPRIGISTDSGLSWRIVAVDAEFVARNLGIAPDGTIYAGGVGGGNLQYIRSDDGGETWAGPWQVMPPGVESAVQGFSGMAVGEDGRVAFAMIASGTPVPDSRTAPEDTRWHLHLVWTDDADQKDPAFWAVRATSDPIQVGPICFTDEPCRNLLDFIDAAAAPDGTFYVSYADGCTGDCATMEDPAPEDSRDSATAVAWLEGWSLKEAP